MNGNEQYFIIIPSYEPDGQIIKLCESFYNDGLKDVVIIDDGSGPEYEDIFNEISVRFQYTVLRNAVNLGKGRALKNAFNYVLNTYPRLTGAVTADSDGQHTLEDIKKVMETLICHPAHLILGCRQFDRDGVPWKSRFGNELTKKVCGFLCGIRVSDTQTGLRGIPREIMRYLMNVPGERFEFETNMLIACKGRAEMIEVPIQTVYDSKKNHRTHFDPVLDSVRIYIIFAGIFLKFMISSFSSSMIDLVLFHFFCTMLKPDFASTYAAAATVLARVLSGSYNYLINKKFVFHSSKHKVTSAAQYFVLAFFIMCASALLTSAAVRMFPGLPETAVKAVADTVLFFISYKVQQSKIF